MAFFNSEQAAAVAAIQQVINEWGDELDQNSGTKIGQSGILTQDVRYFVGGEWREGRAAVSGYYLQRWDRLTAGEGAPVMRHLNCNFRVHFTDHDRAQVTFQLLFFSKMGEPPFVGYCDPLAVADVRMECRREADSHWRIALFDSRQIFQRG